jgi:hypothetical protein
MLIKELRHKLMKVFPSFLIVYDQTIPVVAAQLLFTVGVTCALAFELPSEPIYKITQKLRQNLLGIPDKEEEEETTAAADTNSTDDDNRRIDYNRQRLNYNYNNRQQNYYDSMNKHSYYYSANNKYYHKPLSSPNNYYFSDKSDNYDSNYIGNNLANQQISSAVFVTPKPVNQTTDVWAKVKT